MNYPHPYAIPGIIKQKRDIIEEVHEFMLENFGLLGLEGYVLKKNKEMFTEDNIKSKKRYRSLVVARGLITYYLRTIEGKTYKEIGSILGGKNHSTLIHAYQNLDSEKAVLDKFKKSFMLL